MGNSSKVLCKFNTHHQTLQRFNLSALSSRSYFSLFFCRLYPNWASKVLLIETSKISLKLPLPKSISIVKQTKQYTISLSFEWLLRIHYPLTFFIWHQTCNHQFIIHVVRKPSRKNENLRFHFSPTWTNNNRFPHSNVMRPPNPVLHLI